MKTELRARQIGGGSFAAVDVEVTDTLYEVMPAYLTIEQAKRDLALRWLGRPRGFFARFVWALRLAFGGGR